MQKAASEQWWKNREVDQGMAVGFIGLLSTYVGRVCDDWAMEGRKEPGSGMWEVRGWLALPPCVMVSGVIFMDHGSELLSQSKLMYAAKDYMDVLGF